MAWTVSGNIKGPGGADATVAVGAGIQIAGSVATYGDLPTGLTAGDAGKAYFVSADGKLYIWSGTAFPADGAGTVFRGPDGTAATVAVGTVTTGVAGSSAAVSNSGTSSAATFNFTIPRGDAGTNGNDGAAATIAVGTVSTGAAGSSATVTNSGSSNAATFDFSIPRGADGTRGTQWYIGTGAPGAIGGSAVGDKYLDTASGDVYELS